MKKRLSIGFFTAALAAFIALAAAYHFTYERAVERAREEVALSGQEEEKTEEGQSGQAVTTEGDAVKGDAATEDAYYLMEVNAAYTGSEKFAPGKRFGFFDPCFR